MTFAQPSGELRGVRSVPLPMDRLDRSRDVAYHELFEREYRRLVRALGMAFGDVDAAADAVQDAFVQAHRHWKRVRGYDDPAAWLRRVATNRMHNTRRGRQRQAAALARLWYPDVTELPPLGGQVAELVRALPAGQRITVCLYYVADLSVREVAAAMGVSEGTVKSQLHDARRALRADMEVADERD